MIQYMHGCIIVFMLDYLIIQQGGLFKKWSIDMDQVIDSVKPTKV